MNQGRIRIGLSGWSYRHWRGDFYPQGLPARAELDFALDHFATLELNRSFYSLVSPASYRRWYERSPRGFRWAIKGSRFITHNKKLAGVEAPLANFLASGILELREKLGPILWQLSPSLRPDLDRLDRFLRLLPTDTGQAAAIAAEHTMPQRETVVEADLTRPVRHVLEVRQPGWFAPEVADIARAHRVALAFSHSSRWPYTEELTTDFAYLRLHGPRELYASPYSPEEMRDWAARIGQWASGASQADSVATGARPRDVYVYFDNDTGGHAPRQALELKSLLGQRTVT